MNKFTEGPWEVREIDGELWPDKRISIGPQDSNMSCCVAISPRYAGHKQMIIDAHLIAAAPEMYAILKYLSDNDCITDATKHEEALAALAKAEGKL